MPKDLNIARCFEIAKKLTLQAAEILKHNYKGEKFIEEKIMQWNFVTDYDQKIEKLLLDGLSKEFPDHKIIAEEMTQEMPELTDAPTWFVDPIDGTMNFIHALPHFCISIGLTVRKEPVLGIIYDPTRSELYSAIKDKGAFLNGKPIHTTNITELNKALLMTDPSGMVHFIKPKDIQMGRIEACLETIQCVRSFGSAALAMAYVARGAIDCFQLDAIFPWDVAAGIVIVREAGGTVQETKGGVYDIMKPNTIAASNETLAQELSKLIIDADLKTQRKRLTRT